MGLENLTFHRLFGDGRPGKTRRSPVNSRKVLTDVIQISAEPRVAVNHPTPPPGKQANHNMYDTTTTLLKQLFPRTTMDTGTACGLLVYTLRRQPCQVSVVVSVRFSGSIPCDSQQETKTWGIDFTDNFPVSGAGEERERGQRENHEGLLETSLKDSQFSNKSKQMLTKVVLGSQLRSYS
ncbi:hypothetical protein BX600DRAFT_9021 [Xylariales sp. PMI_506]|nr:hypothetical protein BX600DRAFT_9021 [Xylariales sp. PMI_506]